MRNASSAVAGAAVLVLQGCGAAGVRADWLTQATHGALRPFHVEVSAEKLASACGDAPAMGLYGCAVRIPDERLCVIYTTPHPESWVMAHEQRHCDGFDHG